MKEKYESIAFCRWILGLAESGLNVVDAPSRGICVFKFQSYWTNRFKSICWSVNRYVVKINIFQKSKTFEELEKVLHSKLKITHTQIAIFFPKKIINLEYCWCFDMDFCAFQIDKKIKSLPERIFSLENKLLNSYCRKSFDYWCNSVSIVFCLFDAILCPLHIQSWHSPLLTVDLFNHVPPMLIH